MPHGQVVDGNCVYAGSGGSILDIHFRFYCQLAELLGLVFSMDFAFLSFLCLCVSLVKWKTHLSIRFVLRIVPANYGKGLIMFT